MSTFLVPATIIGNVLIIRPDPEHGCIHTSSSTFVADDKLIVLDKRKPDLLKQYLECRIRAFDERTGEVKLELQSVSNNSKWYNYWLEYNDEWAQELPIKWIFLE